jgi:N-hydroxyarylamine O-acetyltransferase
MSGPDLNGYFERIGLSGSIAPTLATLQQIHALHAAAIPFENIDPWLGVPVSLDQPALERKLVKGGRGGWCFEHNMLLLRILRDLDYAATPLAAHVLAGRQENEGLPEPGHMLVLIDIDGLPYLADVGFGGLSPTSPIKLRPEVEQETSSGIFRISGADPALRLEARGPEGWRPLYQFALAERSEAELAALNQAQQAPGATLTTFLAAARALPGRRLGLTNAQFTIHADGAEPERRMLTSLEEIRAVLTTEFGITLPAHETLDSKLMALLPVEA